MSSDKDTSNGYSQPYCTQNEGQSLWLFDFDPRGVETLPGYGVYLWTVPGTLWDRSRGQSPAMGVWLGICTERPDHPPSLLGFTFNSTAIPPFQVQGLFVAMDDPYLLKRLMVLPLGYI